MQSAVFVLPRFWFHCSSEVFAMIFAILLRMYAFCLLFDCSHPNVGVLSLRMNSL